MSQDKLKELEPLFFPRSIAIVGASTDPTKSGSRYLKALVEAGFKGKLYAVGMDDGECHGHRIVRRLADIPGEVDYVIVAIPREGVLSFLDDCAASRVKAVQFFTAGFTEMGEDGRRLEEEMVKKARRGGFRIVGPNCVGICNPYHNTPLAWQKATGVPGNVAMLAQSGGIASTCMEMGITRGLRFSRVVSFGNGSDLDSPEYLEYLMLDPDTKVIGAYLEGITSGTELLRVLKEAARRKPVVLWKGGRTEAGTRTTSSHTGALKGSARVWSALAAQTGVVEVRSLEEMVNTLLAFQNLGQFSGQNVGVVTGFLGGGGGLSVYASDIFNEAGLQVLAFSEETRRQLGKVLPAAGSITCNPVDLTRAGADFDQVRKCLGIVGRDPGIDVVVAIERPALLVNVLSMAKLQELHDKLIDFSRGLGKPVAVVSLPGNVEEERLREEKRLGDAGIACFASARDAVTAISHVGRYWRWRDMRSEE